MSKLASSLSSIMHRGPDYNGFQELSCSDGWNVGFGHARLSIVGIGDAGNQPMFSACGRYAMTFNGEIYNYKKLLQRLVDIKFRSDTDSEVLLEYFCRYGIKGLSDVDGIFAVAFYDLHLGTMYLARDQIGVKPLYYFQDENGLYFSSEIRGVREFLNVPLKPSSEDVFDFLNCGFVFEPRTGFSGLLKVPAGKCLIYKFGESEIIPFFDIEKQTKGSLYDEQLVRKSIESQTYADVKMGVFFSGGVDSSIVTYFAKLKDNLFVRFRNVDLLKAGVVDDWPFVKKISRLLGFNVKKIEFDEHNQSPDDILNSMRATVSGIEELISDYTFAASARICKEARDIGCKVMLSGMGGDECFIGYPRYKLIMNSRRYYLLFRLLKFSLIRRFAEKFNFFSKKINRLVSFYESENFIEAYSRLLGNFSKSELQLLLGEREFSLSHESYLLRINLLLEDFDNDADIIKALILDYYGFLSHNLTVVDKSSMSYGLEVRVPLLSKNLYCALLSTYRTKPKSVLFGKIYLKDILRKALPSSLINRPKTGFNPPLDEKINSLGSDFIKSLLDSSSISRHLNKQTMFALIDRHFSGIENNTYKIWQLIYLSLWLNKNSA